MIPALRLTLIAIIAMSFMSACTRKKKDRDDDRDRPTSSESGNPTTTIPDDENSKETDDGDGSTGDSGDDGTSVGSETEQIEQLLAYSDNFQKSNAPRTRATIEAEIKRAPLARVEKAAAAAKKVQSVHATYIIDNGNQIYTDVRILVGNRIESVGFLTATNSPYEIGKSMPARFNFSTNQSLRNVGGATLTCLTQNCLQFRLRFEMPTEVRGQTVPVNVLYSYNQTYARSVFAVTPLNSSRAARNLYNYLVGQTQYEEDSFMAVEKSEVILGSSHMQVIYLGGNNEGLAFNLPLKLDQFVTANLNISVRHFQNLPLNGTFVNRNYYSKVRSILMSPISNSSDSYEMMIETTDSSEKSPSKVKFVVEP
jgi:hypothetical protein